GVRLQALERQANATAFVVQAKDVHFDFLPNLQQLARVLDAVPGQLADVDQTVSSAEIDECAKSRRPLTTPRRTSPSCSDSSRLSLRASRISRCASRWLSTRRRRRRLTSMILTEIFCPTMLDRLSLRSSSFRPRARSTTWLAGMKPRSSPKGTIRPPRLASATTPV